jgi:hypothetical protein
MRRFTRRLALPLMITVQPPIRHSLAGEAVTGITPAMLDVAGAGP